MFNSPKDHSSLCVFTFNDGRRCTMPQSPDDMGFCYYHAEKLIERKKSQIVGQDIAKLLDADITTGCDLNAVFNSLFIAAAHGVIKPKTAATLARIGQLMLQTQRLAKEEFLDTFTTANWPDVVHQSPAFNIYHPLPTSAPTQPKAKPAPHAHTIQPVPSTTHSETNADPQLADHAAKA
jgi:hypothetical protein